MKKKEFDRIIHRRNQTGGRFGPRNGIPAVLVHELGPRLKTRRNKAKESLRKCTSVRSSFRPWPMINGLIHPGENPEVEVENPENLENPKEIAN